MKGRQNYLCPRRLERALQQANELFTGPEQNELKVSRNGRAEHATARSVIWISNRTRKSVGG